jgi:hypothetical protein
MKQKHRLDVTPKKHRNRRHKEMKIEVLCQTDGSSGRGWLELRFCVAFVGSQVDWLCPLWWRVGGCGCGLGSVVVGFRPISPKN